MNCSPFAKNIYTQIEEAGSKGFNPAKCKIRGVESALLELKGHILHLSEELILSRPYAKELEQKITAEKKVGDPLTLDEAKKRSGLSRRVLIPLLEYFDQKGLTSRSETETERIITKLPV